MAVRPLVKFYFLAVMALQSRIVLLTPRLESSGG